MGFKRSVERMHEIEQRLRSGMNERGIEGEAQEQIVKAITSFALYGFPESHSASFALIAYASAYLKRHHPTAFFLSLLNAWPMGFYHPATPGPRGAARGQRGAADRRERVRCEVPLLQERPADAPADADGGRAGAVRRTAPGGRDPSRVALRQGGCVAKRWSESRPSRRCGALRASRTSPNVAACAGTSSWRWHRLARCLGAAGAPRCGRRPRSRSRRVPCSPISPRPPLHRSTR